MLHERKKNSAECFPQTGTASKITGTAIKYEGTDENVQVTVKSEEY